MFDRVENCFREAAPQVDFWSLRVVRARTEGVSVLQGVLQPVNTSDDIGAMVTVYHNGGMGYAATSDLTKTGLKAAADRAVDWAQKTAGKCVVDFSKLPRTAPTGEYCSPVERSYNKMPLAEKTELIKKEADRLKIDDRITEWVAFVEGRDIESLYITSDGGRVFQSFDLIAPGLIATAHADGESQTRSFGGHSNARQGGFEVLEQTGFFESAPTIAAEAIELLSAPNCPTGNMDLVLAPDQMVLQIHESIGHPLELDRILGDERNYAGTSFVKPEMFGSFQYGSKLLNVTYDPTVEGQFASFGFDDDGAPAKREYVIKDGILVRPLGGTISQLRAGLPGVANSRATSWNRAPIDRMANLNLEPGESTFDEIIGSVENGVYMETNNSWSIDDSRNKFQFGCERAHEIKDGKLGRVLKNGGYRGISSTFWRSLKMVGNRDTWVKMGTPNCGKGEPNQVMWVGHASPTCLFSGVDVFGGE